MPMICFPKKVTMVQVRDGTSADVNDSLENGQIINSSTIAVITNSSAHGNNVEPRHDVISVNANDSAVKEPPKSESLEECLRLHKKLNYFKDNQVISDGNYSTRVCYNIVDMLQKLHPKSKNTSQRYMKECTEMAKTLAGTIEKICKKENVDNAEKPNEKVKDKKRLISVKKLV